MSQFGQQELLCIFLQQQMYNPSCGGWQVEHGEALRWCATWVTCKPLAKSFHCCVFSIKNVYPDEKSLNFSIHWFLLSLQLCLHHN